MCAKEMYRGVSPTFSKYAVRKFALAGKELLEQGVVCTQINQDFEHFLSSDSRLQQS